MMAANYRHIGGGENRLGRHYSRFSGFCPTAFLADQSLASRNLQNGGSNRRSRAKVHVVRTLVRPTDHLCGFTRPRVPATGPRYRRALLSVTLLAGSGGAFTPLPCASGSRCRRPTCDAAPPPVCAPVPPSRA